MRYQKLMFTLLFGSLLACLPVMVLAGAGHDHEHGHDHGSHSHDPVSQEQAQTAALKQVERLVKKGKIKDSWKGVKASKAEKKTFGKKEEWVVSFTNEKVNDASKRTLYIFLGLDGEYIAANFSGK